MYECLREWSHDILVEMKYYLYFRSHPAINKVRQPQKIELIVSIIRKILQLLTRANMNLVGCIGNAH